MDSAKSQSDNATAVRIRDIPSEMRPREELKRRGAEALDAEKLLAILMRIGQPGQNVTELARRLLLAAGGLEALAHMTYLEITGLRVPGIGEVKAMELEAAFELGRRAASGAAVADPRKVKSANDVFEIMEPIVRGARQEFFYVLILDARSRLVGQPVKVATGSHDRCPAGATEIFGAVMRRGCTAAILAHNHPSGDPSPSREDINVTTRLSDAAKVLGIRLVDHVIIGRRTDACPSGYTSMAEGGMI